MVSYVAFSFVIVLYKIKMKHFATKTYFWHFFAWVVSAIFTDICKYRQRFLKTWIPRPITHVLQTLTVDISYPQYKVYQLSDNAVYHTLLYSSYVFRVCDLCFGQTVIIVNHFYKTFCLNMVRTRFEHSSGSYSFRSTVSCVLSQRLRKKYEAEYFSASKRILFRWSISGYGPLGGSTSNFNKHFHALNILSTAWFYTYRFIDIFSVRQQ